MIAGLVFLLTYIVLALGQAPVFRIDRTGAAIIGAIAMVTVGGLTMAEAWAAIDYRTLVLLFGMMVLVAHLRMAHVFAAVASGVGGRVHHPVALLVAIVFVTGLLSALFVNDTICIVFTPMVIEIARRRRHRALPYLLAVATASNIGSVATITGNPQNMLIGSLSHIPFREFSMALAPVAAAGLAIDAGLIALLFRRDLHASSTDTAEPPRHPVHRALAIKALIVAAGVLGAFLAGLDTALVSASGAAVLLVTRRVNPEKVYRGIDWNLLVLFVGLFVVVAGVERAGLDRVLFEWLRPVAVQTVTGLSVVVAVLSNAISNVPAVMLFTRLMPGLPDPRHAWLVLAMSSTLAGNLTLLGSVANLIVLEGARRHGETVSFAEYLRVGVPLTMVTMAIGAWWLS